MGYDNEDCLSNSRPKRPPTLALVLLIPALYWCVWLCLMFSGDRWSLFSDNWFMTVTMCIGSFIAGATSEGGGAVAFPVMTLIFKIEPAVARDFSLMIQSVGMTAAALTIVCLRIPVEWRAVLFAGLGGAVGIVVGIDLIFPLVPPAYIKMFFTSLWLSFAVALFMVNRNRGRVTHQKILKFQTRHALCLFGIGILGGIVSGLTGSGLDVVTFTLLTLFFHVSEKVATPTSVI
ncbi:MAG: putative membrane protein YfcA, partial [Pirellulaceae bacterium]